MGQLLSSPYRTYAGCKCYVLDFITTHKETNKRPPRNVHYYQSTLCRLCLPPAAAAAVGFRQFWMDKA